MIEDFVDILHFGVWKVFFYVMDTDNIEPETIKLKCWEKFQSQFESTKCTVADNTLIEKLFDILIELLSDIKNYTKDVAVEGKSFEDVLVCKQCCDIFYDPVTLFCGHTFCKECIRKRFEQSYIELCMNCDANSKKIKKWFFSKKRDFQKYQSNVVIATLIKDLIPHYVNGVRLRLEGNQFFQAKNYTQAEEKYLEALNMDPLNFLSWSNLSNCQAVTNRYNEALFSAQQSIEISPSWPKAYYREGTAYKGLDEDFRSVLSYLKFVLLEENSPTVKQIMTETIKKLVNPTTSVNLAVQNYSVEEGNTEKIFKEFVYHGVDFILSEKKKQCVRLKQEMSEDMLSEKFSSELTCVLCCRILYRATTTPCGHTFCASCIERSLDYNTTCSICRYPIDKLINVHPKPVNTNVEALVQILFPEQYKARAEEEKIEKQVYSCDASNAVEIPIFVCTFTFPTLECPLHIFEPRYKLLIRRCIESGSRMFGMCNYNDNDPETLFSDYGIMLEIRDFKTLEDGRFLVDAVGGKRFKVLSRGRKDGYNTASVSWVNDDVINESERGELEAFSKSVYEESHAWLDGLPFVITCRLRQEFGQLPQYNEGSFNDECGHGPRWIWWMLRLLVQGDAESIMNILKSTSCQQRITFIKDRIAFMQRMLDSNR